MVELGMGVYLLPRTMAQAADARQLRAVDIARGGVRRHVALVHRGEADLTPAAKALRETNCQFPPTMRLCNLDGLWVIGMLLACGGTDDASR